MAVQGTEGINKLIVVSKFQKVVFFRKYGIRVFSKDGLFTLDLSDDIESKKILVNLSTHNIKATCLPIGNRIIAENIETAFNLNMPSMADLIKLFDRSFEFRFPIN